MRQNIFGPLMGVLVAGSPWIAELFHGLKGAAKFWKTLTIISFGIVLAPRVSTAGDAISLDQLVAEAWAHNPEANVYRAEIAAAKGERRTAGEWQNPEGSTETGAKIVRDYHGNTLGDGIVWTVGATQTFEYPGRVTLRKAIARHQIALAELGLEGFRTALATRVRASVFRAALGQAKANAAGEVAKRLDDLVAVLAQRPAAGVAQEADVRIIQASVIPLKRRPIEAQREIQSAIYELNQLRGARIDSPLALPHVDLTLRPLPSIAMTYKSGFAQVAPGRSALSNRTRFPSGEMAGNAS